MIKRFIIRGVSKKFKGVQKLPAQRKPNLKKFTAQDSLLRQETAGKIARRVETRSHINLTKKVESAFQRTISKPKKANQFSALVKQKQRALTKAFTLSQKRGKSALEKSSTKLNVGIRRFGSQKTKSYAGISPSEARQLGFPPKEVSAEMKAFYAESKPKALTKRYFKTYQKVKEKFYPGKKRSELKAFWKGKVKAELKQAKIDRAIFRDTTVQKATSNYTVWTKPGFVSKPKPVIRTRYKTISSPEKTFDVYTKRWK